MKLQLFVNCTSKPQDLQFFPNALQKGSRFKVGVQGSRMSPRVVAFVSASFCKHSRVSESVAHPWESKIVAKRRTVVTFSAQPSKSANSRRLGGSWSQNAELSSLLDLRWVVASQIVNSHRDRRCRGRETQNCRHFWTCLLS